MASTIFLAPTANFVSKTLNGAITDSATTITLNNTTSLTAPGYAVIDRTDSTGTSTPNAREVIYYTGISGSDLTGVTRAADGSTARSHNDGAIVETMPTIGMWNSLATIVSSALDGSGYLKAIPSPVSISQMHIATRLSISGASVTGIGIYPLWRGTGAYSGPTTMVGGLLNVPRAGTLQWISIVTRTVASTGSVAFDIKKNGTSIFANATTAPAIAAGGTYVSTSSIATRSIDSGDRLQADILSVAPAGIITDITVQGGTA